MAVGGSKAENAKAEANSRVATGPRGINNDERAKGRSWSVPRPYTSRWPIMLMNINAPLGVAAINAGHSGARGSLNSVGNGRVHAQRCPCNNENKRRRRTAGQFLFLSLVDSLDPARPPF